MTGWACSDKANGEQQITSSLIEAQNSGAPTPNTTMSRYHTQELVKSYKRRSEIAKRSNSCHVVTFLWQVNKTLFFLVLRVIFSGPKIPYFSFAFPLDGNGKKLLIIQY